MSDYKQYWGKTTPDGKWRPVAGHTAAATLAAKGLLELWPLYVERLQTITGWGRDEVLSAILYAAAMHDIGKFHVEFQWKAEDRYEITYGNKDDIKGLKNFYYDENLGFYHGTHGMLWFTGGWENLLGNTPLLAASAHHGQFPTAVEDVVVRRFQRNTRRKRWEGPAQDRKAMDAYEAEVRGLFPPPGCIQQAPGETADAYRFRRNNAASLIAFIVSVADWIGSNEYFFPTQEEWVPLPSFTDFFTDPHMQEQARKAVADTGMYQLPQLLDETLVLFKKKRGQKKLDPSRMQEYVGKLVKARLTIIEAPTGDGKTEAAVLLILALLMEGLVDRMVFALPTQATANAMDERLDEQMCHSYGQRTTLVHGNSRKARSSLTKLPAWVRFVKGNPGLDPENGQVDEDSKYTASQWLQESRLQESMWLKGSKKSLLNRFISTTIDQPMMSGLRNNKHAFVRQGALSTAVVVLDEVHATDLYQSGILESTLANWAAQGTYVILLSATLPGGKRGKLMEAFRLGMGIESPLPPLTKKGYPLVTSMTAEGAVKQRNFRARRRARRLQVKIVWHDWMTVAGVPLLTTDDLRQMAQSLIASVEAGACTCCIVNTVGTASSLWRVVGEMRPQWVDRKRKKPLYLLHAGFSKDERYPTEQEINKVFGKKGTKTGRRHPALVIGTQILEQSLDVDFDRMVRQLSPLDGIIQAMGRCHRHGKAHARPKGYKRARLEVWMPFMHKEFPKKSLYHRIYIETTLPLMRTWHKVYELQQTRTSVREPQDVPGLINEIFSEMEPLQGTLFHDAWEQGAGRQFNQEAHVDKVVINMKGDSVIDTAPGGRKFPTRFGIPTRPFLFLLPTDEQGVYRVANKSTLLDLRPFLGLPSLKGLQDSARRKVRKVLQEALYDKETKKKWAAFTEAASEHTAQRSNVTQMHGVVVHDEAQPVEMQLIRDLWEVGRMFPRGIVPIVLPSESGKAHITLYKTYENVESPKDFLVWYDTHTGLEF